MCAQRRWCSHVFAVKIGARHVCAVKMVHPCVCSEGWCSSCVRSEDGAPMCLQWRLVLLMCAQWRWSMCLQWRYMLRMCAQWRWCSHVFAVKIGTTYVCAVKIVLPCVCSEDGAPMCLQWDWYSLCVHSEDYCYWYYYCILRLLYLLKCMGCEGTSPGCANQLHGRRGYQSRLR